MKPPLGTPGIGGSLGQCALCGETFLVDVVLNRPIKTFTFTGCENTLYGHLDCLEKHGKGEFDVMTLPEKSPLRRAYERATK